MALNKSNDKIQIYQLLDNNAGPIQVIDSMVVDLKIPTVLDHVYGWINSYASNYLMKNNINYLPKFNQCIIQYHSIRDDIYSTNKMIVDNSKVVDHSPIFYMSLGEERLCEIKTIENGNEYPTVRIVKIYDGGYIFAQGSNIKKCSYEFFKSEGVTSNERISITFRMVHI